MREDRCCWPGCSAPSEITVEGKPLCDKHDRMVSVEDRKTADRARAKIGLKPVPVMTMKEIEQLEERERTREQVQEQTQKVEPAESDWKSRFESGEFN